MDRPRYPSLPVLIIDDESMAIESCESMLLTDGMDNTIPCDDPREVLGLLDEQEVSVILLDLTMPKVSGLELLEKLVARSPNIPVIIITGTNEVPTAVKCMQMGAFDYMVKPVRNSRLVSGVRRAIELRELRTEYESFRERVLSTKLEKPEAFSKIITNHCSMFSLFHYVETIAGSPRPVLITGETGVGKELIAKAVHDLSGRKGPFLAVNVAGLDDPLFSDALFGHLKGSFTGADATRAGMIEQASGGSLLLDEICDLSALSQVKLLRLVQEREYLPLGANVPRESNAGLLLTTNGELETLVHTGRFRADLYYRLRTHHVHVPPLRDRLTDIPLLIEHFLREAARTLDKKVPSVSKEIIAMLTTYQFPGNVRELEAMIFDAVSRHSGSAPISVAPFRAQIDRNLMLLAKAFENSGTEPIDRPLSSAPRLNSSAQTGPRERQLAKAPIDVNREGDLPNITLPPQGCKLVDVEKALVLQALKLTNWNQTQAASLLGLSRDQVRHKMRRHSLQQPR